MRAAIILQVRRFTRLVSHALLGRYYLGILVLLRGGTEILESELTRGAILRSRTEGARTWI